MQYLKNGTVFYTSPTAPAFALSARATLWGLGATVNNASLGLYPRLVWERQSAQQAGRRRWPAFALASFRTWWHYRTLTARICVDGRDYIRRSKAEFTVAKDQYVRLNTGWFSDRSGCYLAAGRPVIIQETGFTRIFGKQDGLFAFNSLGEIAEAVKQINADYSRHSHGARKIAREFFEAEKILRSLLDRAGI